MDKMDKLIDVAIDNRYFCTECNQRINKHEKYFRRAKTGYRSSHTINLCVTCIMEMANKITSKDIINRKKMNILNKITKK